MGYRHAAHSHRPEAFYYYGTVGRYRALDGLLRGTIDVDEHGIAGPQTVVVGGGNVHVGLKGEFLVVEQVVTVYLLLLALQLLHKVLIHRDGVAGEPFVEFVLKLEEILVVFVPGAGNGGLVRMYLHALVIARGVFDVVFQTVVVLRVLILRLLLLLAVARAVVARLGVVRHGAKTFFLGQALVFLAHTSDLRDVDTTLHQLHHDLLL